MNKDDRITQLRQIVNDCVGRCLNEVTTAERTIHEATVDMGLPYEFEEYLIGLVQGWLDVYAAFVARKPKYIICRPSELESARAIVDSEMGGNGE